MQTVIVQVNEVCLRYLDNSMLCSLPPPGPAYNIVSTCAAKNKRRRMEDRHVVVHDLNTIFNIQEASPSSYYAIFDGHAGHDAAAYCSAHLHQFLAESQHFVSNPEQALLDAFAKTDALFIEKCNIERFSSGTTAVCALLRPKEKTLYIAWVGDSQALLVNQGRVLQCVHPHKPSRTDERKRIEDEGGFVSFWGTWRVNGQLAVSRAIGDAEYKPYVSAVPDIREIPLDGGEDFLILACDGLWDFLSEDDTAQTVYNMVCQCPDKTDLISERLVQLSKDRGSGDNISVIVVFLREPSKISAEAHSAHWANRNGSPLTMDTSLDNANNPFANSNGAAPDNIIPQKSDGLLLNLSESFKQNGGGDLSPSGDFFHNEKKTNGKRLATDFDDDDDLGPETDVDGIDDLLSPSIAAAKALADGIVNNNPEGSFNPFVERHEVEKAALEIDLDLQMQQSSEFDGQRSPREETPTPPADAVHDAGGLEDNAADSAEDSEDEWNYFKGEEANKENISPSSQPDQEVADILEDDNMSQLNPNAAEFVPVSPTRSIPSPVCRSLINDPVIAQSPKRPADININLPNPREFENEVKSRPSDVDTCTNGHEEGSDQKAVTPDLMENLLNGKNIDEIPEFQPGATPTKVPASNDEFHFGPNAAPFTPSKLLDQSEASSTRAVFGDESTETIGTAFNESVVSGDYVDFATVLNKESDPMSMSFYQDRDDSNVLDLNKAQDLHLDDFLGKSESKSLEETVSSVLSNNVTLDNDERILTTDLDKMVDEEKELESPVSQNRDLLGGDTPEPELCNLPKSPVPHDTDKMVDEEKEAASPISQDGDFVADSKIHELCDLPVQSQVEQLLNFDEPQLLTSPTQQPHISPEPVLSPQQALSPEPQPALSPEPVLSPQPALSPEPVLSSQPVLSPEPVLSPRPAALSPEPVMSQQAFSPEPVLSPQPAFSPEPERVLTPEPVQSEPRSPQALSPVLEDFCQMSKPEEVQESPVPQVELCDLSQVPQTNMFGNDDEILVDSDRKDVESPLEDITSSVKDTSSPIPSPIQEQVSFAQEISNEIQKASSPISQEPAVSEVCPTVESIVTADIHSFEEKTQICEEPSPSPVEQPELDLNHPLSRCVYPLPSEQPIDVKTDNITPEYPQPEVIVTPSDPIKEEAAPVVPEETKIETEAVVAGVAVAAAVAATATAAVVEKKTPKPKTPTATATKKAPTKTTPLKPSPTKAKPSTLPPKTAAAPRPITKPSTLGAKPAAAAKPAAPKPAPRPRTTLTATKPAPEKKPMTNGDVKPALRSTLSARKPLDVKTSPKPASSLTKSPAAKPASATRPTTAPPKTTIGSAAAKPAAFAAPKPRPHALPPKAALSATRTSSATSTTRTTLTKTTTAPKATTPPKPRPATAPAKPRVPLTKTITKTSADTEKQNKESANKITAARSTTSTTRTTGTTRTSTTTSTLLKKTEAKVSGTRTTLTKTTTSTTKSPKKPAEITRTVKAKTTKIEKPVENGVSTVITEQITVVNNAVNDSDLVKDNSPVDNKLLVETNAAD